MKPDVARFLEVAIEHLMTRTVPALPEGYEQATIFTFGMMLGALGEEFERAAARRVEENRALRALFADAAGAVADAALAERLRAAAAGDDPDLRVAALERTNAELRALLIDLHAHVETLDTPDARRVERAIWDELVASTDRRRLSIGPF